MASASTCVPAPVLSSLNGLEGLATWNHQDRSILIGLAATAVTLWWFGWYVLFSARARAIKGVSLLRRCAFYYCVSVGAFGAIRGIWDTGRLLLVGAAFHNLMEWGFLAHVWLDQKTAPLFFRAAVFYSWCVITITAVLLPQLLQSVAFEQTLGIQCDYFLALSYGLAWATRRHISKDIGAMWRSAFFASLLHFFQIWPLVAGSVLGPCHPLSRVLEFLLTTGSMPCFYFYTDFALQWDEQKFGSTLTGADGESDQPLYETLPNGNIKILEFIPSFGKGSIKAGTGKRHNPYQAANHWNALANCVAVGLLLGLLTIGGAGSLPRCTTPTIFPCPAAGGAPAPAAAPLPLHPGGSIYHLANPPPSPSVVEQPFALSAAPQTPVTPHLPPSAAAPGPPPLHHEGHAYSSLSGAAVVGLLGVLGTGAAVAVVLMQQLSEAGIDLPGFLEGLGGGGGKPAAGPGSSAPGSGDPGSSSGPAGGSKPSGAGTSPPAGGGPGIDPTAAPGGAPGPSSGPGSGPTPGGVMGQPPSGPSAITGGPDSASKPVDPAPADGDGDKPEAPGAAQPATPSAAATAATPASGGAAAAPGGAGTQPEAAPGGSAGPVPGPSASTGGSGSASKPTDSAPATADAAPEAVNPSKPSPGDPAAPSGAATPASGTSAPDPAKPAPGEGGTSTVAGTPAPQPVAPDTTPKAPATPQPAAPEATKPASETPAVPAPAESPAGTNASAAPPAEPYFSKGPFKKLKTNAPLPEGYRLATAEEAKAAWGAQVKPLMQQWDIVQLDGGYAEGSGYGGQAFSGTRPNTPGFGDRLVAYDPTTIPPAAKPSAGDAAKPEAPGAAPPAAPSAVPEPATPGGARSGPEAAPGGAAGPSPGPSASTGGSDSAAKPTDSAPAPADATPEAVKPDKPAPGEPAAPSGAPTLASETSAPDPAKPASGAAATPTAGPLPASETSAPDPANPGKPGPGEGGTPTVAQTPAPQPVAPDTTPKAPATPAPEATKLASEAPAVPAPAESPAATPEALKRLPVPQPDRLQAYLHAGLPASYSGGTAWKDISGHGRHFKWDSTPKLSDGVFQRVDLAGAAAVGPPSNSFALGDGKQGYTMCLVLQHIDRPNTGIRPAWGFAFWDINNDGHGVSSHVPWSDYNIYFDNSFADKQTDGSTTRIFAAVTALDYPRLNVLVFRRQSDANGGKMSFWVNGAKVAESATRGADLHLGPRAATLCDNQVAHLQAFAVYNAGLTDEEIQKLTAHCRAFGTPAFEAPDAPKPRPVPQPDSLQAYLHAGLPDSYAGGTAWKDLSGNNRHFKWDSTPKLSDGVFQRVDRAGGKALGPPSNSFGLGDGKQGYTMCLVMQSVGLPTTLTWGFVFRHIDNPRQPHGVSCHVPWSDKTIYFDNMFSLIDKQADGSTTRLTVAAAKLDSTGLNVIVFRREADADGGKMSIWIGGVKVAESATRGAGLRLGPDAVTVCEAQVANVQAFAAYNAPLTDEQIQQLMAHYKAFGTPAFQAPEAVKRQRVPQLGSLQAYLHAGLPESYAGGTAWKDLSGHSRHFKWDSTPNLVDGWFQRVDLAGGKAIGPPSNTFDLGDGKQGHTVVMVQQSCNISTSNGFCFFNVYGDGHGLHSHIYWPDSAIYYDCSYGIPQTDGSTGRIIVPGDKWNINIHHVLVFRRESDANGGKLSVWGNGVKLSESTERGSALELGPLPVWVSQGQIANVQAFATYNVPLTDAEIQQLTAHYTAFGSPAFEAPGASASDEPVSTTVWPAT